MPKITFLKTGETHEVEAGASFLDHCQSNNAPADFGCTVGSCGTCCIVITEGADQVNAPDDEELETVEMATGEEGARLGCRLVVNGDISVRPADR